MLNILSRRSYGDARQKIVIDGNPSIAPGLKASDQAIAEWLDGATKKLFVKHGPLDTDWIQFAGEGTGSIVIGGGGGGGNEDNIAGQGDFIVDFGGLEPDVTLEDNDPAALQTAINDLEDGEILAIKTDAAYNPIVIPAAKSFIIYVMDGYAPSITGAECIRLSNGAARVAISGLILEDFTTPAQNERGGAISFAEHETKVQDIIFHNLKIRNLVGNGSAIMLSYHWSVGGDTYFTPTQINELSERITFSGCYFSKACNDGIEGGCITIRGCLSPLVEKCRIDNAAVAGRGIQLLNCLVGMVYSNDVTRIGGGNAEGIKIDQIGISPFVQSVYVKGNRVKNCIEGVDIDDNVIAVVKDNHCYNCTDEGISIDNDSKAIVVGNICHGNNIGIRAENGSGYDLKQNCCYNNVANDYQLDDGGIVDDSNSTTADSCFVPIYV